MEAREERADAEHRLAMLDAVHAAIERRFEVVEAAFEAESPEAALAAIQVLLHIPEHLARSVIDLQLRRLTRSDRERIDAQRARLRAQLHR